MFCLPHPFIYLHFGQEVNSPVQCGAIALSHGPPVDGFTLKNRTCQVGQVKIARCLPPPSKDFRSAVFTNKLQLHPLKQLVLEAGYTQNSEAQLACANLNGYLGMIKDTEFLTFVKGEYMQYFGSSNMSQSPQ